MEPEVNTSYSHQFEFEGKNLEVVLKSYKEPFKKTMAGDIALYTKVEIFDSREKPNRWGHMNFETPVFDHEQAFTIFQAIEKDPMKFKDQ